MQFDPQVMNLLDVLFCKTLECLSGGSLRQGIGNGLEEESFSALGSYFTLKLLSNEIKLLLGYT